MMEVQKYLKENGLEKLQQEFKIDVTDYPDFVVLNYNQIESPRFHPIVDECRALILEKGTWSVLARSFDRFYNWQESVSNKLCPLLQRVSYYKEMFLEFDLNEALVQEKVDGSLLPVWKYKGEWYASTRKRAYAEGQTSWGNTFADVFWEVANKINLKEKLNEAELEGFTVIFEMVSPETRVVTPYPEKDIILIGGRNNITGKELNGYDLDCLALQIGVKRPKKFRIKGVEDLLSLVNGMESMQEGVVLVKESINKSHWRVKVKNPKYLAISNMRNNGVISPKMILLLIRSNDHHEYIQYFPEDKKYFDYIENEYKEIVNRINETWEKVKGIEDQKEFALTMMPLTTYSFEKGVLFAARKNNTSIAQELNNIDVKRIEESVGLKKKFSDNFNVNMEED
jgi:hypothetical protein